MEWLWIIQLAINFMVGLWLLIWWSDRKSKQAVPQEAQWLSHWDHQVTALIHDSLQSRRRLEAQVHRLGRLCEQAESILAAASSAGPPGLSAEERELKSIRDPGGIALGQHAIPSVLELEQKQHRQRLEIPSDLKSLLRDQLS